MQRLPALPEHIRLLRTDESAALDLRYPQSKTSIVNCLTCKGTKTFRWYAPGTSDIVDYECPCTDQYVLSRWLWNSGIQPTYQRLGWRDFERLPDSAAIAVSNYLDILERAADSGLGLTITGPKGNGKTMLAYLILKEAVAKGLEVYATSFTQMIDTYAEGWRDKALGQWFNRRLRDAPLLFIDDLGRERNKGAGSVGDNMLETVLRHRVGCSMPTIITSNIDAAALGEAYGGHTESLLSEVNIPLLVQGADIRRSMLDRRQQEIRDRLTRPVVLA